MIAADRNAGRMDLRVARIGEERALFVSAIGRGDVAAARVGRKIKNVAVTAGREHHGVAGVRCDFAGDQIARDDSFGVTIDHDEIEHFGLRKHLHRCRRRFAGRAPDKRRATSCCPVWPRA